MRRTTEMAVEEENTRGRDSRKKLEEETRGLRKSRGTGDEKIERNWGGGGGENREELGRSVLRSSPSDMTSLPIPLPTQSSRKCLEKLARLSVRCDIDTAVLGREISIRGVWEDPAEEPADMVAGRRLERAHTITELLSRAGGWEQGALQTHYGMVAEEVNTALPVATVRPTGALDAVWRTETRG